MTSPEDLTRPVPPPPHPGPTEREAGETPFGTISSAVVREWARAQGYDLPDRGRIPWHITQAWEQSR
ncbi:histone-like nucleoid-structuring protein Lsr2 [Streptomyces sp. NPDC007325]|uniref:Lsr2 family DNA-binding protein n=1 Tax=Streptomyces sp. NPDC007325 TaxID=3154588 RepID=UPI0033E09B35